jgi:LPXTG-site transpeptidase (sortase) family protein
VSFVAGNLSSFTITTTGVPAPTLGYVGTLPSGIGFTDNGNGTATLSGTPALTSVGTYNLTFTASNGVTPNATQNFTLTIDGPPGVARINSSADTGDGQMDENEHTSVAITQLLVVFNKAMNADTPADLDDALNVENYSLTRDGSTVIVIDPTITYAAQTAALNINDGLPLPNGRYTFTVEGDIEDTLGAPIGTNFVRVFYVDNAVPSLASFTRQNPSASLTNADTLIFRANFSEEIQNANAGDFIVNGTTATVTGVAAVTGSSIYDITVSGGDLANLNGTVGLDLAAGQNITDLAGNPLPGGEPATDETYLLNNSYPTVIYGSSTAPEQNSILSVGPTQIVIEFNKDVLADGSANAATSPANYLLVEAGVNAVFDAIACGGVGGGLQVGDTRITVNSVTYANSGGTGPFLATLNINGAVPLLPGTYRLFICGTSSIYDPAGNRLNNGADSVLNFSVQRPRGMPDTGFAPNEVTVLPEQPADKAYADLGNLWIEIPKLNLKTDITGVPRKADGWDVTWLHWQVGWLEGSAYPTWEGNTVLTAHGYTADGEAGPFALLKNLSYGETIVIHLGGMKYTYAVRTNLLVNPNDTRWLTKHEELDWITLITCQQYDAKTKSYRYRRVVRAVLLRVEKE